MHARDLASNPGSLSCFVGGSLVHTVCACVNISVKISVKLSGYYQRTRGLGTYTAMSGENTETKIEPTKESLGSSSLVPRPSDWGEGGGGGGKKACNVNIYRRYPYVLY